MSLSDCDDISLGVDELLKDSRQMREHVMSLLDEIKFLKKERDKYMRECRILKEAMHLKDNASIERLEQIRKSATAQILEIEASQTLSKGLPDADPRTSPYCDFFRNVQPQGEQDDGVYSAIYPTAIEKATTDAIGPRTFSFNGSIDEKIELDVHSEPASSNARPPPLPKRRIFRQPIANTEMLGQSSASSPDFMTFNRSGSVSSTKDKKRNSFSKIIKNLSLKKDPARDGGWV